MASKAFWTKERCQRMYDYYLPRHEYATAAIKEIGKDDNLKPSSYQSFTTQYYKLFKESPKRRLARTLRYSGTAKNVGNDPAIILAQAIQSNAEAAQAPFLAPKKDSVEDQLFELLNLAPKKPAPPINTEDVFILNISDCHFGSETDATITRFEALPDKLLPLIENCGQIWINLLGDIADGEGIHPNQPHQQDVTVAPYQVELATEALWQLGINLSQHAPVVFACVFGNHGRMGLKKSVHNSVQANFDMMCYMQLDCLTRYSKYDIKVITGQDEWLNVTIGGVRWHLRHIMGLQGGTPAQEVKFLKQFNLHKADALAYGHYHTCANWQSDQFHIFRCPTSRDPNYFTTKLGHNAEPGFQWIRYAPGNWPNYATGPIL